MVLFGSHLLLGAREAHLYSSKSSHTIRVLISSALHPQYNNSVLLENCVR
jgi:ribosomal protein L31